MQSTVTMIFHIICAVLTTCFSVLASRKFVKIYRECGYQGNAYVKTVYERCIKSYWVLFIMAVEYAAVSSIFAEGTGQIVLWIVFLLVQIAQGWLYLRKIGVMLEKEPNTRYDIVLLCITGLLTGVFTTLSMFSAYTIMSLVIIFIPVLLVISGAITKPFRKTKQSIL